MAELEINTIDLFPTPESHKSSCTKILTEFSTSASAFNCTFSGHWAKSHNTNISESHCSLNLTCFTPRGHSTSKGGAGIMRLNILPVCQSQHAHPDNEDKWSASSLRTAALSAWRCMENTAVKAQPQNLPPPTWPLARRPAQGTEGLLTRAAFIQPQRHFNVINVIWSSKHSNQDHFGARKLRDHDLGLVGG